MSVDLAGPQDAPVDLEQVELLATFRAAAHRLEEYIQTRNDIAWQHDLAAGINRKLAGRTLAQGNEVLPPVTPDYRD